MNPPFRKTVLKIQSLFNHFDGVAKRAWPEMQNSDWAPVFLIGAPRTGSTFLYQVLAQNFCLSYISNIMALFPCIMVKMTHLCPSIASRYPHTIRDSDAGYISGLFSPNEAGKILSKWFSDDNNPSFVRNTVAAISWYTKSIMFFKNQMNTLRIPNILNIFPNAKFLFFRRNPLYTAQSLIKVREKIYGTRNVWWSVKPPGYVEIQKKDALYQVLWQVHALEELAEKCMSVYKPQCATIYYEEFCNNPKNGLNYLADILALCCRSDSPDIPDKYKMSNEIRLSKADWAKLVAHNQTITEIKGSLVSLQ